MKEGEGPGPQPSTAPVPAAPAPVSPPQGRAATSPAERWLYAVLVVSLLWVLVAPTAMLLTEPYHRDALADDKVLTLGFGVLFASVALVFSARLIRSLDNGDYLGVESHWGGLGGGVGGWRISTPVIYLVCVVSFGALAAVSMRQYPNPGPSAQANAPAKPTVNPAAGATAETPAATPAAPPVGAAAPEPAAVKTN